MLYYNFVSIKHISQLYPFISKKDFQRNEIYQKKALYFEYHFSEARTATLKMECISKKMFVYVIDR